MKNFVLHLYRFVGTMTRLEEARNGAITPELEEYETRPCTSPTETGPKQLESGVVSGSAGVVASTHIEPAGTTTSLESDFACPLGRT